MIITVNVTKNHIKKGRHFSCTSCPIALALAPRLNTTFGVYDVVEFNGRTAPYYYAKLPKKALDFIDNFDGMKKVKPFRFQLRVKKEFVNKR